MKLNVERFCENVRRLRIKNNLSEETMAEILGLSKDNLQLLESGVLTDEMDIRILEQIYYYFGIRPNQMFGLP